MKLKLAMAAAIFVSVVGGASALPLFAGSVAPTRATASEDVILPDGTVRQSAPAPSAASPAAGSAGCRHAQQNDATPGATVTRELISGGIKRTYRVHLSANTSTAEAGAPLVLLFHGRGGSGQLVEGYSGMLPVSDREGFLLVSPDGVSVSALTGWGAGASPANWPVDDVQFGRDLVAQLKADFCVAPTRVYAVGHSNGAFMAARLGCAMPGEIAAIAPVAGISIPAEGCGARLPVIAFHGTADDTVPYGGGKVRDTFSYPGAEHEIAGWASNDGCTATPGYEPVSAKVKVERFYGCNQPVRMILGEGAGHSWPTAAEAPLADLIWSFLSLFHT